MNYSSPYLGSFEFHSLLNAADASHFLLFSLSYQRAERWSLRRGKLTNETHWPATRTTGPVSGLLDAGADVDGARLGRRRRRPAQRPARPPPAKSKRFPGTNCTAKLPVESSIRLLTTVHSIYRRLSQVDGLF